MSIIQANKIDFIGIDKITDEIILSISDHLDWNDEITHLEILQNKLNSYIEFIECGQIFEDYPNSKGKKLVIEIVSQYKYSNQGKDYIGRVQPTLNSIGVEIRQRVLK